MLPVLGFLYSLTVEPIEYILETAFCYFRAFFSGRASIPMAITAVSLLVNLLTLPIYNAADARQLEERELQKKMGRGVAHIKAAFSGDERFLMLSEYYRQNHYSPLYALRGSLSILIQIPFFMAAYNFLSGCQALAGVSLGPIQNLLEPDSLVDIGKFHLNLLPVLMTTINLLSGAIYTKSAPVREKVQVYGLALLFLVLLYGSPSGLVFYWTLNNIFSLAKNFIQGRRNPARWVMSLCCLALTALCLYMAFFKPRAHLYKKLVLYAFTLVVCLSCFLWGRLRQWALRLPLPARQAGMPDARGLDRLFMLSCVGLALLVGSTVPLSVLGSDPLAFSFLEGDSSPFRMYWPTLAKAAGLFLLWPFFIYKMSSVRSRSFLSAVFAVLFLSALLNFYAFSSDYGVLSNLLVYAKDDVFETGGGIKLINLFVLILVIPPVLLVFSPVHKKASSALFFLLLVLDAAVAAHSVVDAVNTKQRYDAALDASRLNNASGTEGIRPLFTVSRKGKNVFCIMLDRATGVFLEECFREDPRLYEQYDGFTFYPNTVSFSTSTLAGFPGLYGGYEYVPAVMNLRDNLPITEKLEEAASLLPRIFARNGFSAVMTDIPAMGLNNVDGDFFFMDRYQEGIKSYLTDGAYKDKWKEEHGFGSASIQLAIDLKRFLPYSVMRAAPVFFRQKLYEAGNYLISSYHVDYEAVTLKLSGLEDAIGSYSTLDYLPALTEISDDGNNFTFMSNMLTHCPCVLQLPDYIPALSVSQESPSRYAANMHYYVNMAALKLLGKWLDSLKAAGAYDNTRIIISADHGCEGSQFDGGYSRLPKGEIACLLLVKDFGSHGRLKVDGTFMTNADVPSIAVSGLIDEPLNPVTGNDITKISLKNSVYGEYTDWDKALTSKKQMRLSVTEGTWYSVHDDILDSGCWGKPSSAEAYEQTRKALEAQGIGFEGGGR